MNKFDMNKVVKEFFDSLNTKLEYDEDIEVNSIDELVDKVNKYIEEEK
jgi:hypothetical protein